MGNTGERGMKKKGSRSKYDVEGERNLITSPRLSRDGGNVLRSPCTY